MNFRRILLITASLVMSVVGVFLLLKGGVTFDNLVVSIFSLLSLMLFLFEERFRKWVDEKVEARARTKHAEFRETAIFFPKGYYFRQGFMKKRKALPLNLIDEIRINTYPITAKINSNELIFLLGLSKEECIEKAKLNNIPIVESVDHWSLICSDFLDIEIGEKTKEQIFVELSNNGISKEEVEEIRKRLNWRMMLNTYYSLAWMYYGHYDVLTQYAVLTKNRYWWTMDIGLRGSRDLPSGEEDERW